MGQTVTESQGVMAVSAPQSDFNTAITPNSGTPNFRLIIADSFIAPPDYQSPNVTNQGEATGSAYGTKTTKGRADANGSFSVRLTFQGLGFWAYRSFGVYGTPSTLAAGVYQHDFSMFNPHTNRILPAWTPAIKLNEPALSSNNIYDYKYRGAVVESAEFAMPHSAEKPNLMANIAWRGSGKRDASGVQFFGAGKHVLGTGSGELNENYIKETTGTMHLYTAESKGGTDIDVACDFYDFAATIQENLNTEIGYFGCAKYQDPTDPNSASVRGEMPVTEQTVSVAFTLKLTPELKTALNLETARESGQKLSADFTYLGTLIDATYNHKAIFSLNSFVIQNIEYVTIDGVRGIRITTEPLGISNVMPFSLRLVTNVATFATFVG